jgi:uncharacterized protein
VNPVREWQILSTDPEATARFYAETFGWTIERANALGYRRVSTGESGAPGGIWPAPPTAPPFVQLFVDVEDVDDTVARAVRSGATVLVPRSVLPDGDVMAVLRDAVGLSFGVVTRARKG